MFRKSMKILALLAGLASHSAQAGSILVENLDNDGPGSLRMAIETANTKAGADSIEFAGGLNGTIVLGSDLPSIVEAVDVLGPGAGTITVSGDSKHRPFFVSPGITVAISGLSITDGQANVGGGISNQGALTVTDCILSGNNADTGGGAIDHAAGTLLVSHSVLTGNSAGTFGGAISIGAGSANVTDSTLAGNSADFGGAISNFSALMVVRSTLSGNAADIGGAVENFGTLNVLNSTLSDNAATMTGGGIDNFKADATVVFSTLAENASAGGAAGIANDGTFAIKNSLVVNSTSGDNCIHLQGGTFDALGANFATDDSCPGFTQSTPGAVALAPLDDNGGPTETHALLSDSVAIDAALDCALVDGPAPVTQDQRGVTRPQGSACDSGSFEVSDTESDLIMMDGFENS